MNKVGCISARRRISGGRTVFAVALWVVVAGVCYAAPNKVAGIRFWSIGETTRIAVEVTGEFKFKSDRLSNPDRLYFDIPDTSPGADTNIAVGDERVKQIRVAETRKGVTRVVLDLAADVDFTSSQLANPERLIIELRPKNAAAAASEAKPAAPPKPVETKPQAAVPKTVTQPAKPIILQPPPELTASAAITRVAAAPVNTIRADVIPALTTPPPPRIKVEDLPEPRAATRNSNGDRSLTRVLGLKLGRIVIDPGHGGHDQGTHGGKDGLVEKEIVLDISKRLAALLKERSGADVILTRSDDTFVSLEDRTKIANDAQADLFLSVHVNSSPFKGVAGVETYYLNFSASREDLDLATRENATTKRTIADFQEVVSKIALRAKLDESREFALRVQQVLQKNVAGQNKDAKDRGVKRAPFVVLIGAEMPSVLAEVGFLSNTKDEELLQSDKHRDRIAESLFEGIQAYSKTLSESQVASRQVE